MRTNTIFIILLAFAGGLIVPDILVWAQEGINVTTTTGTAEEVPTLEEAIQNSIKSWIAIAMSIFVAAGVIIKSGIFDRWVSRKKQLQTFDNAQMGFLAIKGVLEDKILTKAVIEGVLSEVPEERKQKYIPLIQNLDKQIQTKSEQIDFYTKKWSEHVKPDQFSSVSPDLVQNLPREDEPNIAYTLDSRIPKRITLE